MQAQAVKQPKKMASQASTGKGLAVAPAPFKIDLEFVGIPEAQQAIINAAKARWEQIVKRGESGGLLIKIQAGKIDLKGGTDARTKRKDLVPGPSGIPVKGVITFDEKDLNEESALLFTTALHEIGHVLGIGMIWKDKKLLQGGGGPDGGNPTFIGPKAMSEYGKLLTRRDGKPVPPVPIPVPVQNTGDPEFTRDCHWRETVFGNSELMTPAAIPPALVSKMTIASLQDLGYEVNLEADNGYDLP